MRTFGPPDIIHRRWDVRAAQEISPDDVAVFAASDETAVPDPRAFDDSHDDYVVAAGGDRDR